MPNEPVETPGGPDEQAEATDAAEQQQADPATDESEGLREELERLIEERKHFEDQLLRTMAEFQNYRKRMEQKAELDRQFATERLVTSLLPVLDNFERTIAAMEAGAPPEKTFEGIKAVDRQFRTVLEGQNVRRIRAQGEPFDPELHEAIATEATEEHPENTVVGEVEPGYRMADKVIRPARVRVARKP